MNSWSDVNDFGHYGITNSEDTFYPNVLEMITKELLSGNDFDTGWHGFKKELESMRIEACGDTITVCVHCYCDDMPDELISDCDNYELLTDKQIDEIMDYYCNDNYYNTEYTESETLPRTATLEEILNVATNISNDLTNRLNETYEFVNNTVQQILGLTTK